jgi:hypothetical protein
MPMLKRMQEKKPCLSFRVGKYITFLEAHQLTHVQLDCCLLFGSNDHRSWRHRMVCTSIPFHTWSHCYPWLIMRIRSFSFPPIRILRELTALVKGGNQYSQYPQGTHIQVDHPIRPTATKAIFSHYYVLINLRT